MTEKIVIWRRPPDPKPVKAITLEDINQLIIKLTLDTPYINMGDIRDEILVLIDEYTKQEINKSWAGHKCYDPNEKYEFGPGS